MSKLTRVRCVRKKTEESEDPVLMTSLRNTTEFGNSSLLGRNKGKKFTFFKEQSQRSKKTLNSTFNNNKSQTWK